MSQKSTTGVVALYVLVFLVAIIVLVIIGIVTGIIPWPPGGSIPPPQPTATPAPTATPEIVCKFDTPAAAIQSLRDGCALILAVSSESPPFSSGAISPQGYEIDILNAIIARWEEKHDLDEVKVEFKPIKVVDLDDALNPERGNNIVARAISNTTQRCGPAALGLCTSPPHFQDNYGLLTLDTQLPDSFDDPNAFCDEFGGKELRVAVLPGTVVTDILEALSKRCIRQLTITQVVKNASGEALAAVKNGEADIYMTDYEVLKGRTADDPALKVVEFKFLEEKPAPYVFILPKGQEGLRALLEEEFPEVDYQGLCNTRNLPADKCPR